MNLFDLNNKTALITGSSQGIGLALARGLAAAGAKVILNGRDVGKLEETATELASLGASVITRAFDVTDHNACLLYTSPSPRDQRGSRMPSSA